MTNAGLLQYTMPNLAGFSATNSVINYALNAPAVGTNFPLSIDGSAIVSGNVTGFASTSGQSFRSIARSGDDFAWAPLAFRSDGSTFNGGIQWSPTNATLNMGTSLTGIMTWLSSGRVGVGTVSPSTELHVVGSITSSGGYVGDATGSAIAAGRIGEVKKSYGLRGFTNNSAGPTGWSLGQSQTGDRTLTPGVWLVTYGVNIAVTSGTTSGNRTAILTTDTADGWGPSSNLSYGNLNFRYDATPAPGNDSAFGNSVVYVTSGGITGGTGFNLQIKMYAQNHTSFSGTYEGWITAVRIA
jgi:hypothetical protein